MAQPVLVRAYTTRRTPMGSPSGRGRALPPISAFSFADILRAADSADFQEAIDGIAEICAKNCMSLAEEHSSHMPPVGEITGATDTVVVTRTPYAGRPNAKRALTIVPEGSSSGSERSKKGSRMSIFEFSARKESTVRARTTIRIGSMGRSVPVASTTSIDWAVPVQDDVAKLKASVAPQLAALNLLFQQISLDKLSSQGASIDETLRVANVTLSRVSAIQPYTQLSKATYDNTDALLQNLAALRSQTSATATQGQLSDLNPTLHDVARQGDILSIAQHLATLETQMATMQVNQDASVTSTRHLAVEMRTRLSSIHATIGNVSHKSEANLTNRNARQSSYNGTQIPLFQLEKAPDFLPHIDLFLAALRTHIIAIVALLLRLVPNVRLFLSTALTIVRSLTFLLSDNILLTDVLGRKLTLPYQHFRLYPVLVARLRSALDDCLGQLALSNEAFEFFLERGEGVPILVDSAEQYESMIAPRKKLIMSISNLQPFSSSCPACRAAPESGNAAIRAVPAVNVTDSYRVTGKQVRMEFISAKYLNDRGTLP
nr:hypothetical protein B0A51_02955 [Rachicladosporium sp. CCFEE 5018]